jgi:hypothetical protein
MEDDEFSDSETNISIIETPFGPTVNFKGKLSDERTLYKKDKKCIFCGDAFGLGILHAKKHFCKFCYRGICAKCSPKVAFHPEDKKNLRICNFCCENSLKESFSESFNIRTSETQNQISLIRRESAQQRTDIQSILKEIYKLESLIHLESEKLGEILNQHQDLPDLTKEKSLSSGKLQNMVKKYEDHQKILENQDLKIKKLSFALQIERNNSKGLKENLTDLKDKLSDIQDARVHLYKKGVKRSSSLVLSEAEKKEEADFNSQVIKNFELETENLKLFKEIEKIRNENLEIEKKIKNCREEVASDRLVTNDRNRFNMEEEEKIRVLRNKQKNQQAMIEKLKLELRMSNNKDRRDRELRGDDEEEEAQIKETTRPCARCEIV